MGKDRLWIISHALGKFKLIDLSICRNFLRMHSVSFEEILIKVALLITKKDTVMGDAIPPDEKLSVALRFLATSE